MAAYNCVNYPNDLEIMYIVLENMDKTLGFQNGVCKKRW